MIGDLDEITLDTLGFVLGSLFGTETLTMSVGDLQSMLEAAYEAGERSGE